MVKKLITACTALVALAAFALPATASAANDPDLTHPTGTLLNPATGSCTGVAGTVCITATGLGSAQKMTDTSGNTLVECSGAEMTGYLTKNNGTEVEGTVHSASFAGTGLEREGSNECTSSFGGITVHTKIGNGTPWCLRSTAGMNEDEFQVRGGSCSEAARSITFVLTSTTVGTCKYSRAEAVKGTYTTHSTGDAIVTISGSGATGGTDTEFTKEEGGIFCPSNGTLDLKFTLETDTTFQFDPFYIS
jgi:hypothetical protein